MFAKQLFTGLISMIVLLSPLIQSGNANNLSPLYPDKQARANIQTIHKFYNAFKNNDGATMISCYHKDATFHDPAFGHLNAEEVKNMWLMLLELGKGQVKVEHKDVYATGNKGEAKWEAWYTFSATGNQVHNKIEASFEFKDGLIYRHRDSFDYHRWSAMALGFVGDWFGGNPMFQDFMRSQARDKLFAFMKKQKH